MKRSAAKLELHCSTNSLFIIISACGASEQPFLAKKILLELHRVLIAPSSILLINSSACTRHTALNRDPLLRMQVNQACCIVSFDALRTATPKGEKLQCLIPFTQLFTMICPVSPVCSGESCRIAPMILRWSLPNVPRSSLSFYCRCADIQLDAGRTGRMVHIA